MSNSYLEFEEPILEMEKRLKELKILSPNSASDIEKLESKVKRLQDDVYKKLTPWQVTQLARHPQRPYTLDYIDVVFDDFTELHGDRSFKDDPAIVGGIASLEGQSLIVIGHQKGRTTKDKIYRNFAMPHPEGFRKATRLMRVAERFSFPLVTFIDTPGAYPGIGAEERGQSEAIAESLQKMASLKVPIIAVIIGEGGSGGALALGVGDRILMLEYTIYSIISPEGCAAILWKDGSKAPLAADALKLTSRDLLKANVIDEVIKEPSGGAHRDYKEAFFNVKESITRNLKTLLAIDTERLVEERYMKFRKIGRFKK